MTNRLSDSDSLTFAHYLCNKLAKDLDAGDLTSLEPVSKLLAELPAEALILAIPVQITLERIIHFNLDEMLEFLPTRLKINTLEASKRALEIIRDKRQYKELTVDLVRQIIRDNP